MTGGSLMELFESWERPRGLPTASTREERAGEGMQQGAEEGAAGEATEEGQTAARGQAGQGVQGEMWECMSMPEIYAAYRKQAKHATQGPQLPQPQQSPQPPQPIEATLTDQQVEGGNRCDEALVMRENDMPRLAAAALEKSRQ